MFIYDDNFLTEEEIIDIENAFFSDQVSWAFFNSTQNNGTGHPGVINVNVQDVPYFSAGIPEHNINYNKFKYMIDKFCSKHQIEYAKLGRVKLNATPWSPYTHSLYPHVDKDTNHEPHLIFLYYVKDSDGDTVLYDQTFTGRTIDPATLSIMQRVTPKRGAAFIVSGEHFHAITPPNTVSMRCVINANLDLK